ncbi:MAG: DNA polymerase IV [Actinomycetota bacterium]|nr:DNA polymerase IV [Actinomycetota bacterium]
MTVPGLAAASRGGIGVTEAAPSILHVDMDAFFVAVELLERPDLVGRPVVVGGSGNRGVVAAASYEARAYGIHSAMPSARAARLCPSAVFLPGRYHRYQEVSTRVGEIFASFTPQVESISLDEAFLDVSHARRLFGDGRRIAVDLRERVRSELGLGCSVGVAPRKLTAKLASEAAKPTASLAGPVPGPGVVVVTLAGELAFLHAHPVEALWGVGPATRRRLDRLAVRTVADLAAVGEDALVRLLGNASGRHLHALAHGRDERPVVNASAPKSIGHEETFAVDHHSRQTLQREAVRLADAVAGRLRRAGLAARTVQLKVRFGDFRTITRSTTSAEAFDTGADVTRLACRLLADVDPSPGVRLLGVSVSQLGPAAARQLSLEETGRASWTAATGAVDLIRGRFGDDAIVPATLADADGVRVKRRGDQQWGPTPR